MKLSPPQIQAIREKVGAQPIPENNGLKQELTKTYGEHTFYVDPHGLNYWEPVDTEGAEGSQVRAVRIASWADGSRTELKAHAPVRGTIVAL
jgi:hypothetical protein